MDRQSKILCTLALGLMLAACNQGGRPPNVKEQVDAAPVRILPPKDMGQTVGGAYVVAPGDTLATVAERTNTPMRTLIDMNHLQPPYAMTPGMKLALKQRSQYVVQSGDTLPALAQRYGVTESALVGINNLQMPYKLKPGQTLDLPSTAEASNLASTSMNAVPPPTPVGAISQGALPPVGNTGSGLTASALPPPTIVPTPTMPAPTSLAPKVIVPATPLQPSASLQAPAVTPVPTVTTASVAAQTKAAQSAAKAAAIAAVPTAPVAASAVTSAAKAASGASSDAQSEISQGLAMEKAPAAGSGTGAFAWPVQGKVINAFGSSTDGLKNDGINIAAPAGSPVVAAAAGTVAYAGNELRGFGNMVLIRHDGGFVTAYAHNDSLLVKKGDVVKRGQTIARVGATGAVFGPQLHFEIRKGTEPVDPMTYLGG